MRGKYISLTPGKEIKQTWALQSPTWPDGKREFQVERQCLICPLVVYRARGHIDHCA